MDISSSSLTHHHHKGQPPPLPPNAVESSVQHLLANWHTRQRWHLLLLLSHCCQPTQNQEEEGHDAGNTKRAHLARLLESFPAHLVTILLVILDLTLTVLDLSSSLLSCKYSTNKSNEYSNRYLYHWVGVAILSLLSAKALALALALGRTFFARPGRIVDGVVVMAALALEVVAEARGAGLLVVVSLWQVVRVVESAFELSSEAIEAQIEGVVLQFEALRDQNRQLEEAADEGEKRIKELEEQLARLQK